MALDKHLFSLMMILPYLESHFKTLCRIGEWNAEKDANEQQTNQMRGTTANHIHLSSRKKKFTTSP